MIDSALPAAITTCGNLTQNSVTFNWAPVFGAANYSVSIDGGAPQIISATADSFQVTGLNLNQCVTMVIIPLSGNTCADGPPDTITCCALGCGTINPTITTSATILCAGDSVDLDAGTGFASYLWSNGAVGQINRVGATDAYSVIVSDAAGCLGFDTINITVGSPLTVNLQVDSLSCNGTTATDGRIIATALGGFGSYTYTWSTAGSTNDTLDNLGVGTYCVTITDIQGCSVDTCGVVAEPSAVSVTTTGTDALCFGDSSGTATAVGAGGTGGYSFVWSNGSTTATATNLPAGTYTVTLSDANGCSTTATVTIAEPSAVVASVTTSPALCNGSTDGVARATASGGTPGTPAYTFDWGNGPTALDTNAVGAGNYILVVADANGCTDTVNYTITEPPAIVLTTSTTPASCNGSSDGTATVNASGGLGGFTYLWTDGQTTATATNLPAGQHCVTVTDVNGCEVDTCLQVTEPAGFTTPTFSTTPVSCAGGSDGSATVFTSGGIQPYSYNWSNGDTDSLATNLNASSLYVVTITDANGCFIVDSITVTEPTALAATLNVDSALCKNGSDGQIQVITTGGTFPYTYQWGANANNQNTALATGLRAGSYTVTITDFRGCTLLQTAQVFEPASALTATIIFQQDPSCNGGSNGSMEVDALGATPNYTYRWSDGQTTSLATGLTAGAYTVTITDANGCSTTAGSVLSEPTAIQLNPQILSNYNGAAITCAGAADGAVGVVVAGGSAGYSYTWSPGGQNTANISGLVAGTYCVSVTDLQGCQVDTCITINDPVPLAATTTAVDVLCFGDQNGQIIANAVAGTGTLGVNGYEYRIAGPGQAGNVFSAQNTWNNLAAGAYTVTVRDGNDCIVILPVQIQEPDEVLIDSITTTLTNCNGDSTGSATAYVSGGTGTYTYLWSDGQTTSTAINLPAGLYSVTATDANGCDRVEVVNVQEPTAVVSSITAGTINCFGGVTSATVTASGGTPIGLTGYLYRWDNGQTTNTAIGLAAGTHCVTVTDDNGCETISCVTITQPTAPVSATVVGTDPACAGTATGTATATAAGGTAPYTYLWSDNQTTQIATNLAAGTYRVTITDSLGCTGTAAVTLTDPAAVLATISSSTGVNCAGDSSGTATASAAGGLAPYTYLWPTGQTTATATNLPAGANTVTVTDANGCTATALVNIGSNSSISITSLTNTNVSCLGGNDGTASILVSGGSPAYTFTWSGAVGQTGPFVTGLAAGVQYVTITDALGCSLVDSFVVTEPAQGLMGQILTRDALCADQASGQLAAVITGGTAPYTYAWSGDTATTSVADSLLAGTYTVTVTDALGCNLELAGTVGAPQPLQITAQIDQTISCQGGASGGVSVQAVTGGTPAYTFIWNDINGSTTTSVTGLSAGTYAVLVTDSNACQASDTVTLTDGQPINLNASTTPISCNGETDGDIDLGTNANIASYSWSTGQVTAQISNLGAGTYTVTVRDLTNCEASFSYTLTEPSAVSVTINTLSTINCNGDNNGTLQALGAGGTAPYSVSWSNSQTTSQATNLAAGTYTVTLTDSRGCTEEQQATLTEPTVLSVTGSTTGTLCAGDNTGSLTASGSGGTAISQPLQYQVVETGTGFQTGNIFGDLSAGVYTLRVRDEKGCTADTMLTVEDAEPFFISSMTGDTTIEYGDSITVQATLNDSTNVQYSWTQLTSPQGVVTNSSYQFGVSPLDNIQYQFAAINAAGCALDSIVSIEVTKFRRANAPTGFTPNGDGVNDYFFIQGGEKVQEVTLFRVYDRWGTLVYEGQNLQVNIPEQGWDGIYKGTPAQMGTYSWYADVQYFDGNTLQIKGNITLLRQSFVLTKSQKELPQFMKQLLLFFIVIIKTNFQVQHSQNAPTVGANDRHLSH